ncbi:MAG: hypothetical protein Q9191_003335 [Dirinaria sp. TL-2023a]
MSAFSPSGTATFTPKSRSFAQALGKKSREYARLHLSLQTVIGTTICSPNAFDCLSGFHTFAVCAGSAVAHARVDEELDITQTFYRAGPNAVAANPSYSFYNSPTPNVSVDGPRNSASIFKDTHSGFTNPVIHGDASTSSPGKTKASTRTRAANCVSLSPDGQFLAIGETGYSPRICIFGCNENASRDVPLTILNEHSKFGVHSLAFSPDSRWLCSLGNVNDGFVFLWSISKNGSARLHSSNKCISNVQDIAWMGNCVVTVGTRHVKIWRLDQPLPPSPTKSRYLEGTPNSPAPKTLSGRNCILGSLVDSTFKCVVASSDCTAILCTENGEICLLDDTDQNQRLEQIATVPFKVLCVSVDIEKNFVLVGGKDGKLLALDLRKLVGREYLAAPQDNSPDVFSDPSSSQELGLCPDIVATGPLRNRILAVDASHHIQFMEYPEGSERVFVGKPIKQIPAHDSAVLGVANLSTPNKQQADFFTWSSHGIIYFWTIDGTCKGRHKLALKQESLSGVQDPNALTVLKALSDDTFLYGDKCGNMSLAGENPTFLKVHDGEITDMALSCKDQSLNLVATCGRDRTLQLFQIDGQRLELLQTLENEHAATVNSVFFLADGSTLLSASADRTVVIRSIAFSKDQRAAFFTSKVITLRSSPVSIAPSVTQPGILVVSTMDRQFLKYDIRSGHLLQTFKASDLGGNESVILSSLKIDCLRSEGLETYILLCASSTDRSLRVYDLDTGSLLTKEYGQLAISDLSLVEHSSSDCDHASRHLISAGLDGTIMIWRFSSPEQRNPDLIANHEPTSSESSNAAQPLRRILSRSELSEYQKSLESSQDPPTPTRGSQPSRAKKKTSRLTLAATPRQHAQRYSKSAHHSPSSSIADAADHNSWRGDTSALPSHKVPLMSRAKRSASDAGQHSPNTAESTCDSSPSIKQICRTLRDYRSRLTASSDSLSQDDGRELERELTLTIQAVGMKTYKSHETSSSAATEDSALDGWLTRMIDERLALKLNESRSDKAEEKGS